MSFFEHHARLPGIGDESAPKMLWYPRAAVSGCRLSTDPTRSVPTTDQTGKSIIYVVPHISDTIECWSGEDWVPRRVPYDVGSTQTRGRLSVDLTGLTTATVYDVFVRNVSGAWETRLQQWKATTARGAVHVGPDVHPDGLGLFQGRLVALQVCAAGAADYSGIRPDWLYLGTIYTSGSGTTEDSAAKRFVWNMYNRVPRPMRAVDTTDSWSYSSTWRQANANAANQLAYVCGLAVDMVSANVTCAAYSSGGNSWAPVGVGVDSTSVNSAQVFSGVTISSNVALASRCEYRGIPGLGYHYLAWLEYGTVATTTWYGDNGLSYQQSGMIGEVWA